MGDDRLGRLLDLMFLVSVQINPNQTPVKPKLSLN